MPWPDGLHISSESQQQLDGQFECTCFTIQVSEAQSKVLPQDLVMYVVEPHSKLT
jgi:hypothetical protein